ncbi:hypothetical protein LG198_11990 [Methylobacillus arboreus]|uniref:hypothetical protein n=1 Tax=Methylobacillus arboreus TaxID=755170 RepID=UPI001E5BF733|nr:hypothetical protein [Methylobacillus arboreus]MCB5191449.1 hypothetical protein [Methylobacillus arboreus]
MLIEASALTKLSSAVEAYVRYDSDGTVTSDQQLLQTATAHDPDLLRPFQHRLIKVNTEDRHAILLVCTQDGLRGLLEDAGCSAPMDRHLWQESRPCQFTLQAAEVCRTEK